MQFYHGSSSLSNITSRVLPPSRHSFRINEVNRVKHSEKVFFTTNKCYAEAYARQCCKRVGGSPVVYKVTSKNPELMVAFDGGDVYYDKEAIVLEKVL